MADYDNYEYNPKDYEIYRTYIKFPVGLDLYLEYAGDNAEEKRKLIYWKGVIHTDSTTYLTSNALQEWTLTVEVFESSSSQAVETITKTGYGDINTDISDDKIFASGAFEVPSNGNYRFTARLKMKFVNAIFVDVEEERGTTLNQTTSSSGTLTTNSESYILAADNFTDESDLTITYNKIPTPHYTQEVFSIRPAISFDGIEDIVERGDLPLSTTEAQNYTFIFTDEEKNILRQNLPNQKSKEVFVFTNVRRGYKLNFSKPWYALEKSYVKRTLSIINGEPVLTPVVKDTNETTLALTGDENKIVRYYSNAYVASNVELQKYAGSIANHLISVGGKSTTEQTHTFNKVEGSTFTFTATDSRGFNTTIEVNPPFVDYVKLTCNLEANVVSADNGTLSFKISGNYFNGSFGAYDNALGVFYRIKEKDKTWSDWIALDEITYSGNTYTLQAVAEGLNYQKTYDIQAMSTDRLATITTPIQTLTTIPIFDWGKEDFNFNVPVELQDSLTVNGDTTLEGETSFNSNAVFNDTVQFNGTIDFGENEITITNIDTTKTAFDTDNLLADYIIETGTEEMGTNGTWYWQKWKSGKAECYGRRNFGKMAITTKKVDDVYRSDTFTQDLPSGLFNTAPYYMNINTCPNGATNYEYCWIGTVGSNAISSTSTGGFCVMSCLSQTTSATDITFNVVGTWK
jgi:hypothetical protein